MANVETRRPRFASYPRGFTSQSGVAFLPVRLVHVIARSLLTDSCVVTVGILVGLFMLHRKQGRIEREKRLQYWRDQVHLACLPAFRQGADGRHRALCTKSSSICERTRFLRVQTHRRSAGSGLHTRTIRMHPFFAIKDRRRLL